jgi:hypothetical protein
MGRDRRCVVQRDVGEPVGQVMQQGSAKILAYSNL